MGSVFRQAGRTGNWQLRYQLNGVRVEESSQTRDYNEAKRILRDKEAKIDSGIPVGPKVNRVTWEDAVEDLKANFRIKGNKSWDVVEERLRLHLTPAFHGRRLASISPDEIASYSATRLEETYVPGKRRKRDGSASISQCEPRPYSNGQINRELAILKRMFRVEVDLQKLTHVPHVTMLSEDDAVRKGFFDLSTFPALRAALPAPVDDIALFAYLTGWRITDEVLPLEWRNVDFPSGEVRIDVGADKNAEGRVIIMTTELRAMLKRLHTAHEQRARAGHVVPWVFVRMVAKGRGGPKAPRPIKSIHKVWKATCRAIGLPGRIPHDLRRSAARAFVSSGISERVAMKMTGHKTRSTFDRYNIVSDSDLREAAQKHSGHLSQKRARRARG